MNGIPLLPLAGAFLFCLGIFLLLTRRNAVMALIGVELILNAANLNFAAFAPQDPAHAGFTAILFVIVLAAAETAVALAIILNLYRHFRTVQLDEADTLKDP